MALPVLARLAFHRLVMVQPETVIRWHRTAWRGYWTWKSRARQPGRPRISKELQGLIARIATENPRSGRRPHPGRATRARLRGERGDGEVLSAELGAAASAVPVLANLPRQPPPAALGCGLLHRADAHLQDAVRLLLHHARAPPHRAFQRRTAHPTAPWGWRQLLEATPWGQQPRYLIRDRDRSYGGDAPIDVKRSGGEAGSGRARGRRSV